MPADELLIIGAGPAGLGVTLRYRGASRILERSAEVGGLARSIEFGGGVFDIGGHCFHTPHAEVAELVADLMHGRWQSQPRDARVWFGGELIPYPFQKHFAALSDAAVVEECRASLPLAGLQSAAPAANFEDWIVGRFGAGIARHFLLPYNRKLWGADLRRISSDWVSERVADAGGHRDGARRPLNVGSEVGYPAEGGFGEIFRALAERVGPIEFGQTVVRIDTAARTAHTVEGRSWRWTQLVSTLPLPLLLKAIPETPPALLADVARLEHLSLKLLLVLVAAPLSGAPQRIYVADPEVPPHKVAFNHTSSASLRKRPMHAVMCEIACPPSGHRLSDEQLQTATLDWLVRSGQVASQALVAETRLIDIPYAYPVPTHDRARIVAQARGWLAEFGIHSIGRFGGWDYANSDDCLHQGLQLGARLSA